MKATTSISAILVLLCAARLVCTAQHRYNNNNNDNDVDYSVDYVHTNPQDLEIQDVYLLKKRNKPSLSIVNPMDVLRQRLLLEIARRQMKENTRQVELNRAILKNVGKRMFHSDSHVNFPTQTQDQQQQLQYPFTYTPLRALGHANRSPLRKPPQQLEQLLQPHYANQLEYAPDVPIYDFLQRPAYEGVPAAAAAAGSESDRTNAPLSINPFDNSAATAAGVKAYKANGNGIANETTNHNKTPNSSNCGNTDTTRAIYDRYSGNAGGMTNGSIDSLTKSLIDNERPTENDDNLLENVGAVDENDGNADYLLRYFYRLQKSQRYMRK